VSGPYRLFGSVSMPAAGNSYSGDFLAGLQFEVTQGGCWFAGYWIYTCASLSVTTPQKCALWQVTSGAPAGVVMSGSVVTSGTLTAGQWNYVPLSAPVQMAQGFTYIAAVGVNGDFCSLNNQFGSGDPYAAGISSGPVFGYSDTGGSAVSPWGIAQGVFTTGGSDPSVTMPAGGSNSANFGVDVSIQTTVPSGYAGSYRLWPAAAATNPQTTNDAEFNYTIATEIWVSALYQYVTLDKLWYFSPSGSTELATRGDVWLISSGVSAASIASPTWSGAAGAGWLSAAFAGGVTLTPGKYRVSVYCANGTSGEWGAKDATTDYWGQTLTTGAGAAGITWEPLYAPPQPGASSGFVYNASDSGATPPYSSGTVIAAQSVFGQTPGGSEVFPQLYAPVGGSSNESQNYWVDLEVTPGPLVASAAAVLVGGTADDEMNWSKLRLLGVL
jgi:hypothetical protein